MTERGSDEWPWSALRIGPTADKDAIRKAYTYAREQLDTGGSISAFADLTAAREKALFLASEIQREAERSGEAAPVDTPPPAPEPEPEPELEIELELGERHSLEKALILEEEETEPEADVPYQREGRYADATDYLDTLPPDQDYSAGSAVFADPNNNYDRDFSPIEDRSVDPDASRDGPTPFIQRYSLQKYGVWWLAGLFALLSFCSGGDDREDAAADPGVPTATVLPPKSALDDAIVSGELDPRIAAMSADLFGESIDFTEIAQADNAVALILLQELERSDGQLTGPKVRLRQEMLASRPTASIERALAIAELRLAWLLTAEQQGDAACREVTEGSFNEGRPIMRNDWRDFERSLAAELAVSGDLSAAAPAPDVPAIPDWAFEHAAAAINLSPGAVRTAHANSSSAVRCSVMIALHEAMLARRDEATPASLAAL